MGGQQPVDALGLALPPCDWPSERAAPGGLETIRRFCNTTNLESGADALTSPAGLDQWLIGQGRPSMRADPSEVDRIVAVRELLRTQAIAHRERGGGDLGDLADAIGDVELHLAHRSGRLVVEPGPASPSGRFLAEIGLAVIEAERRGTWRRLKACRNCSWVFYDGSKNRSGRWCSMSACGGRVKIRNYRERIRSAAAS